MALVDRDTGEVVQPLDEAQARELVQQFRDHLDSAWVVLLRLHEGRAWLSLGYETWESFVTAEFAMSRQRAYQLLDQGRVVRAIEEASVSTMVDTLATESVSPVGETPKSHNRFGITEREARRLKPDLHLIKQEVEEEVAKGADPVVATEAAVAKRRLPTPKEAQRLAREHGGSFKGSDGYWHDARTDAEIADEVEQTQHYMQCVDALKELATMPKTPTALVPTIPDYMEHCVDESLEDAFAWLSAFRDEWRNRG